MALEAPIRLGEGITTTIIAIWTTLESAASLVQGITEDLTEDLTEGLTEDIMEDLTEDIMEGLMEDIMEGLMEEDITEEDITEEDMEVGIAEGAAIDKPSFYCIVKIKLENISTSLLLILKIQSQILPNQSTFFLYIGKLQLLERLKVMTSCKHKLFSLTIIPAKFKILHFANQDAKHKLALIW